MIVDPEPSTGLAADSGPRAWGTRRDLIVLFLVSLLVRVAVLFLVQTSDVFMGGDENRYLNRAIAFSAAYDTLAAGEELDDELRSALYERGHWPPLHSMILSVGLHAFGHSRGIARGQQVLLSAITTLLVYWLAIRVATRRAAFLAGLLHALYPEFVGFSVNLWSETHYITILMLGVLAWLRLLRPFESRTRALGSAVLGGLLLGALLLTRPAALPFLLIVPSWLIVTSRGFLRRVLVPAVLTATAIATVVPWELVVSRVEGRFVLLSSYAGRNLAIGNNPHIPAGFDSSWGFLESMDLMGRAVNRKAAELGVDYDVAGRELAIATIRADFGGFLGRVWRRSLMLWTPDYFILGSALRLEYPGLPAWVVATMWIGGPIFYGLILVTACLGLLAGAGELRHAGFLLAVVFAGMLPPMLAFGLSRLHLPLLALLLPLSGFGLTRLGVSLGLGRAALLTAFGVGLLWLFSATMPSALTRHLFPSTHYRGPVAVADRVFGTRTICGDRIVLRTSREWVGRELEFELVTHGYVFDDPAVRRPSGERIRAHSIGARFRKRILLDVRLLDPRAEPLVLRVRCRGRVAVAEFSPLELGSLRSWTPSGLPGLEFQWLGGL